MFSSYIKRIDDRYPRFLTWVVSTLFFIIRCLLKLRPHRKSVLFAGQAYYNAWYLSRELRKLGWRADVLNWDFTPHTQIYYHGEDIKFTWPRPQDVYKHLFFYMRALLRYDIFHFSNAYGIQFGWPLSDWFRMHFSDQYEIYLLKKLGKKILYTNNGCLDGVSQTSFATWDKEPVCNTCVWKNQPTVCNDEKNLSWGKFRNEIADFQCLWGGNRIDYNDAPSVHEVPEVYCLNADVWHPALVIPPKYQLDKPNPATVFLYHTVGHKKERTSDEGICIKSTHIYLPLIEKLQQEGLNIALVSPENIPNKEIKYYQLQSDIFLDMLGYGWYGATAREAMMLEKPVICYLRPEWLASLRREMPECADELPIISATPETIEATLRDLIAHPEKRQLIGKKGREFCIKWHGDERAAKRFDWIYSQLLQGNPLLRDV